MTEVNQPDALIACMNSTSDLTDLLVHFPKTGRLLIKVWFLMMNKNLTIFYFSFWLKFGAANQLRNVRLRLMFSRKWADAIQNILLQFTRFVSSCFNRWTHFLEMLHGLHFCFTQCLQQFVEKSSFHAEDFRPTDLLKSRNRLWTCILLCSTVCHSLEKCNDCKAQSLFFENFYS